MENKKKTGVTIIIIVSVVIVAAALLFIFRDSLFGKTEHFNVTTSNSDIVFKRSDAQEPLNMPYRYSKVLMDKRLAFKEEIVSINISSVRYEMSDKGLSLYNYNDVLKNPDSSNVEEVIGSIKYCKGITALSGIISDKKDSKITIYEGYSADLLAENFQHYIIIPSTLSSHINEELPDNEKVLFLINPGTYGLAYFTVIGEYTTKSESDTLYMSYSGLSTVVLGAQKDVPDHIDCMEINVNKQADLTNFSYFLSEYFADMNMLNQYEKRINRFNEPYSYMFVNTVDLKPIDLSGEKGSEKNIITISRIDGKDNLEMSHVYADALINDYSRYSQYITDLNISTGRKGVNPSDYPAFTKVPSYSFSITLPGTYGREITDYLKKSGKNWPWFHQAVTGVSEIERMKKGCEITFYTNYTGKDLAALRNEDYRKEKELEGDIKGYAIVPVAMHEATRNNRSIDHHIITMSESDLSINFLEAMRVGFKIIGYYELPEETKDKVEKDEKEEKIIAVYDKEGNKIEMRESVPDGYDTIFLTYTGYNDKYKKAAFKNEYIEAITIETRSDTDLTELIKYLKQYFAPAEEAAGYVGQKNELGLAYEYCFTVTKNAN